MLRSRCSFCDHDNPEGSRFCNECGSPLHLAPCAKCEAVNDVDTSACYRCGAPLAFERAVATPRSGAAAPVPEAFGRALDLGSPGAEPASAPPQVEGTPAAARASESIVVPPDEVRLASSRDYAQAVRRRRALRTTGIAFAIIAATPIVYAYYFPDSVLGARLQALHADVVGALRPNLAVPAPEPATPPPAPEAATPPSAPALPPDSSEQPATAPAEATPVVPAQ